MANNPAKQNKVIKFVLVLSIVNFLAIGLLTVAFFVAANNMVNVIDSIGATSRHHTLDLKCLKSADRFKTRK